MVMATAMVTATVMAMVTVTAMVTAMVIPAKPKKAFLRGYLKRNVKNNCVAHRQNKSYVFNGIKLHLPVPLHWVNTNKVFKIYYGQVYFTIKEILNKKWGTGKFYLILTELFVIQTG